jgi:parallel beta-helix repeat protein
MSSRSLGGQRPATKRFRPRLEALEDRSVPAVVTTTADDGDGSLRAAILSANARPGTETITFALKPDDPRHVYYQNDRMAGSLGRVERTTAANDLLIADIDPDWPHSWWSIQPLAELPEVTDVVFIDGYSQPGASPNHLPVGSDAILRIELNGEKAGVATGLRIRASEVTVSGLVINRFSQSGITLRDSSSHVIEGNYLGPDVSGTADPADTLTGLRMNRAGGRIGGRMPMARNLISGNKHGILMNNGGDDFETFIQGNYVGTNATGTGALGNSSVGIEVRSAPRTTVGGLDPGSGNLISGNGTGVFITGSSRALIGGRFNSVVQGNIIGLDAGGRAPLGNTNGVRVLDCNNNLIGGLTPTPGRGAGNVISGNTENGISVEFDRVGPRVVGTVVLGNIIGLDAGGNESVGNGSAGFRTRDAGAQIGGTVREARNIISGNRYGILLSNSGSGGPDIRTDIQGNFVGSDITGTKDRGNSDTGVNVGSAPRTFVGGSMPGAGNLISGNRTGVFIAGISHPEIPGGYNCLVQGNWIGVDASGRAPLGNTNGVVVANSDNLIGGLTDLPGSGAGNVISGNVEHGVSVIRLPDYPVERNRILGNLIGLAAGGSERLGNGQAGVRTRDAGARVGGTVPQARNIISANQYGVLLDNHGTTYQSFIQGNYIGTEITGSFNRGNAVAGVNVDGAPGTHIGTGVRGASNVISGNGIGVSIGGRSRPAVSGLYNCLVQGNIIGLNAAGTAGLGNGAGVSITNGYNLIGGDGPLVRNIISSNQSNGVQIFHASAFRNRVIGNHVGTDRTATLRFANGLDGVLLAGGTASNLIRDNQVKFNARDGISLENADQNIIYSNDSHWNTRDGLRVDASSAANRLIENRLYDNGVLDAHDESRGTGDAGTANRWWMNEGDTEDPVGLLE